MRLCTRLSVELAVVYRDVNEGKSSEVDLLSLLIHRDNGYMGDNRECQDRLR